MKLFILFIFILFLSLIDGQTSNPKIFGFRQITKGISLYGEGFSTNQSVLNNITINGVSYIGSNSKYNQTSIVFSVFPVYFGDNFTISIQVGDSSSKQYTFEYNENIFIAFGTQSIKLDAITGGESSIVGTFGISDLSILKLFVDQFQLSIKSLTKDPVPQLHFEYPTNDNISKDGSYMILLNTKTNIYCETQNITWYQSNPSNSNKIQFNLILFYFSFIIQTIIFFY